MQHLANDRMIDAQRVFRDNRKTRRQQTMMIMTVLMLATLIVGVAGFESLMA